MKFTFRIEDKRNLYLIFRFVLPLEFYDLIATHAWTQWYRKRVEGSPCRWWSEDTGCCPFLAGAWVLSQMVGWENWRSVVVVIGSTTKNENHWENVNVWTPDVVYPTRLNGVQCRQFDPVSGPFSMNNERSKLYFYTLTCLPAFSFPVHVLYICICV